MGAEPWDAWAFHMTADGPKSAGGEWRRSWGCGPIDRRSNIGDVGSRSCWRAPLLEDSETFTTYHGSVTFVKAKPAFQALSDASWRRTGCCAGASAASIDGGSR